MPDIDEKTKRLALILEQVKKEETNTINFVIPQIFSKKAASYMLIEEDLLHAKEAIETLINIKDNIPEIMAISLWRSAISSYGKCFNSNNGGYSVLNLNCFDGQEELRVIHNSLMLLRNSYVSHRDETEHENVLVIMKIPKGEGADMSEIECRLKSLITATPPMDNLKDFLRIIDFLLPVTREKIKNQTQRTYEGFVDFIKTLPVDQLKVLTI